MKTTTTQSKTKNRKNSVENSAVKQFFVTPEGSEALEQIIYFAPLPYQRSQILMRIITEIQQLTLQLGNHVADIEHTTDSDDIFFLNLLSNYICEIDFGTRN